MSDDKVSLDFLGEQMLRMQADMRGVRSEQIKLESEQTSLRADFHRLEGKFDRLEGKVDRLEGKVERLEGKVDRLEGTVHAHDRSNQARFDQIDRTMALNLEITLEAIKAIRER